MRNDRLSTIPSTLLVVLALGISLLAGCSPAATPVATSAPAGATAPAAPTTPPASQAPVTLTFYYPVAVPVRSPR